METMAVIIKSCLLAMLSVAVFGFIHTYKLIWHELHSITDCRTSPKYPVTRQLSLTKLLLGLILMPDIYLNSRQFTAGGSQMRLTQRNNHANISELLDNLLRGYDNSIRPDFGGPPATVEVDIMVRSMGPISEVDMTYSMDCYFRQSWVDRRLAFKGAQDTLALSVSMLARIWKPDTYFYNGKQSYLHTITTPNKFVRIYQNGRVLYSSRLTIKAGCPMNLEDFPMDIQKCPLKFGSFGYTTADVVYRWNKERPAVAIAEDMKLSQFDLVDCPTGNLTDIIYKAAAPTSTSIDDYNNINRHNNNNNNNNNNNKYYKNTKYLNNKNLNTFAGPGAKNQHVRGTGIQLDKGAFGSGRSSIEQTNNYGNDIRIQTSNHPSEYSMLMVNFHLQRHMGNFLIQVYGPCCLLVVLSWVSFWLNREATADRVSLGITTVLTMTFLGLEARTDLPKVPYPTALDFFVFLSFAFIFATILQFAVVHYFTKYGSGECYFIIEELDSDTESIVDADAEADANNASTSGANSRSDEGNIRCSSASRNIHRRDGDSCVASEFNVSTESKIYEVIPLSMCSIPIPPPSMGGSGRGSRAGSGLGGKDSSASSSGIGVASSSGIIGYRNRRLTNESRRRQSDNLASYSLRCLDRLSNYFRKRKRTHVDFNMSDDDDEEAHLRGNEDSSHASNSRTGRRRMSYYRREELEARRKGKRTPQYNSVSKIDRASRIVFPLLFFLINVFYWYGYLSRSSRILATTHTQIT